jgi:CSLREA domain-containing protein
MARSVNGTIQGNFIGTDVTGTLNLGMAYFSGQGSALEGLGGISINDGSSNNVIGGTATGAANVVAFNRGAGIRLGADNFNGAAGAGNPIRGNAIYLNNGLGIALGSGGGITGSPLANDVGDADTGANARQNYPELTGVTAANGTLTVTGTLNSLPSTQFHLDFYANENQDPSGNGEGQIYVGSQLVTTNANGDASISFNYAVVPGRPFTTATATNVATNDTSEFSNAVLLANNPGTFVFSSSSYAVVESAGVATITITRANGSTGQACVSYATANGTATAGADFTQTSGTICFAAGETSKTFNVPINNDATPEATETFSVSLSNPTNGSALGFQSTATVSIINDDSFVTFVVNSTADTDDGQCTSDAGGCTLREAINAANATASLDTISFALGSGNPSITVASALPAFSAPIVIDGNTGGATRIEINGNNVTGSGLTLNNSSSRSIIRNLVINRFNGSGINLSNSSNNIIESCYIGTDAGGTIGRGNSGAGITFTAANENLIGGTSGTTPGGACTGACNLISGNGSGINGDPLGGSANRNVIQGNFVGTDVSGTAKIPNGRALGFLNAVHHTLIGGDTPNARNLISGNNEIGVIFSAAGTHDNVIQGNYIGVNTNATAKLGNSVGVVLFFTATNNSIIGNVVSGNVKRGIDLTTNGSPPNNPPHANIVQGNIVGTDPSGTLDLGNGQANITVEPVGGIVLSQGVYNNDIGGMAPGQGNVVAFNYGAGIRLGANSSYSAAGVGNSILNNSVYSNNGLGIALADGTGILNTPLPNDNNDGDTGANNRQNYPVLTNATSAGGTVTVTGSLNSIPNTTFRIEFFASANPDASANGEGETFVGSTDVTTNGSGNATISFGFAPRIGKRLISATATNLTTGDTSEFSTRVTDPTPQSNPPVVTAADANGNVGQAITISATFTDSDGTAPYTATINCGNSTQATDVTVNAPGANPGTVSGTCTYDPAGISRRRSLSSITQASLGPIPEPSP